ncbi:MAG: serine/threonine protein kinase [Stigonema ocellatum SAG 48.90 = DSM 106950]|nr:serine/threonine protein kinase [Stigonema ocellatum SAG 48.90 = DSM 106950]
MLIEGNYRLLKQIGQGGFCKTFLAVDEGLSPAVPCVVQKFWLPNQTPVAFEQKVQRLEELGKHPQIPALLAHFYQDSNFYLVQEFIEGVNLATQVKEAGVFSEVQIWQLLEDLLPVIKFIHQANVIHRDIKPENIIMTSLKEGNLVLVDFGSAKLVTAIDLLTTEPSIGSPEYAAPEQTLGKSVFASDLYSIGVTCIYLLTQIPPFDLFDIANNCWAWRQYLTIKVSERLGKILDKLLQHDLSHRFQSADEVMQAMGISFESKNSNIRYTHIHVDEWQCIQTLTGHSGVLSGVNSIAMSCDGQTLASGHDDKTIRLWDLSTKKVLRTLTGHSQAVRAAAYSSRTPTANSPVEEILATASDDKTIKLWNLNTLQEICTLFGHSHGVKSVAFSSDGQLLASGSWDKTVKLWDVKTFQEVCTLSGHQLQVSAVAFSPQGNMLASASFDRTIRLWELDKAFKNRPQYTFSSSLSGHAWAVLTVAFSPDGQILATGSDDNTIKLWDVNTGEVICTLLGHSWSVVAVAFSTDGEMLISGSRDKTVKLWRVSTKQEIATLSGHVDSVSAVAFSPDAQQIVSGSRDKTIKLWELVQQSVNPKMTCEGRE